MKMNKENFIATMLVIYAILLTLCLALYAFIDIFNIDKSLASNLLVWSATIYAPIAVLCSLNFWKIQKKEDEKIEHLKKLKQILVEVFMVIDEFRSTSNVLFNLQNNKQNLFEEALSKFNKAYRFHMKQLHFELISKDELYKEDEKIQFHEKLTDAFEIISAIERAYLIVETEILSIPRRGVFSGEEYEYEKNLYLLNPYSWVFNIISKNVSKFEIFDTFESKKFKSINDLWDFINHLTTESYK